MSIENLVPYRPDLSFVPHEHPAVAVFLKEMDQEGWISPEDKPAADSALGDDATVVSMLLTCLPSELSYECLSEEGDFSDEFSDLYDDYISTEIGTPDLPSSSGESENGEWAFMPFALEDGRIGTYMILGSNPMMSGVGFIVISK